MSNYRLARFVSIFTKLAQIKLYSEKLPLIDTIIHLDYSVKLYIVLIIKFIHTYNHCKHMNVKNTKY